VKDRDVNFAPPHDDVLNSEARIPDSVDIAR